MLHVNSEQAATQGMDEYDIGRRVEGFGREQGGRGCRLGDWLSGRGGIQVNWNDETKYYIGL